MHKYKDVVKRIVVIFYENKNEYEEHKIIMLSDGFNVDKVLRIPDSEELQVGYSMFIN